MDIKLVQGDCVEKMKEIPSNTIGAVITDPPYGIKFMSRSWDTLILDFSNMTYPQKMQAWHERWLAEVYRILKPNAPVKAFSASRTFHRLSMAMRNVGFQEIRCEAWVYGQGFPKSTNISRHFDRKLGAVRGKKRITAANRNTKAPEGAEGSSRPWIEKAKKLGYHEVDDDTPITKEAILWDGYGTGLKPAFEPLIIGVKK